MSPLMSPWRRPGCRQPRPPRAARGCDLLFSVSTQSAPEGIRTPNLLIRSQMLYPLSYGCLSVGADRHSVGRRVTLAPPSPSTKSGRTAYPARPAGPRRAGRPATPQSPDPRRRRTHRTRRPAGRHPAATYGSVAQVLQETDKQTVEILAVPDRCEPSHRIRTRMRSAALPGRAYLEDITSSAQHVDTVRTPPGRAVRTPGSHTGTTWCRAAPRERDGPRVDHH